MPKKIPNMKTCLELSGRTNEVPHDALEDAKLVLAMAMEKLGD